MADIVRANPLTRDVDDGLPLPGIDWNLEVNKAEAAKFGASPLTVGTAVQLVTNGVKVSEYRPTTTDKSVDILLRFPPERRSLNELDQLVLMTSSGNVPIGNFVKRSADPEGRPHQPGRRIAGRHRHRQCCRGCAVGNRPAGRSWLGLPRPISARAITYVMKGEDEERAKAGAFLMKAFGAAIFLIFAILLAQFNKFSSVLLVLSAVVLSTIGVLIGLMIMGQAFGVVMTGIGVIANAGVIVNNNIVLIDTYDRLRSEGVAAYEAILQTCRERARPVVLTAVTAMLGVLAIAFGINIDFVERTVMIGAPVHPMVDPPLHRHRLRPRLCHRPDAGGDTGHAHAVRPHFRLAAEPSQGPRRPAPAEHDKSGSSAGETAPAAHARARRVAAGRHPVTFARAGWTGSGGMRCCRPASIQRLQ